MGDLLARILPLALAAAVNPTGLLVLFALLATSRRAALWLSAGFCLVFAAVGAVVLALGLRLGPGHPSAASAAVDIVAAAAIAYLGVRALRRRPAPQSERRRRHLGAVGGFAAGLGLAATDFTSLLPYFVALKDMSVSGLGRSDVVVADVAFLAICLAPMVVPVALVFAAPQTAERLLGPLRRVLARHGDTIVGAVCLLLAAYLASKGIREL